MVYRLRLQGGIEPVNTIGYLAFIAWIQERHFTRGVCETGTVSHTPRENKCYISYLPFTIFIQDGTTSESFLLFVNGPQHSALRIST